MVQKFNLIAILALIGLVCLLPLGAQQSPSRKIGVVDLGGVFKNYKKSTQREDQINAEKKRLENELKAQADKIKKIKEEIDLLNPNSSDYELMEMERDIEIARLNLMRKKIREKLKRRYEEYTLEILEDIENVVKEYGEAKGFSMILKTDNREAEREREKFLIGFKTVLYHDAYLDVTKQVTEILNARFKRD